MDMIKKIAITAATMLFVLAQVFSFYVIFASRQEKIDLLKEKERKIYENAVGDFNRKLSNAGLKSELSEHVIIYCFRENMPENSALYKDGMELYNSSPYEFDVSHINLNQIEDPGDCVLEKSNDKYILVFFQRDAVRYYQMNTADYTLFYAVDVTYIYENSRNLVIQALLISCLASLGMALLLVFLIKKITKPLQDINETQRQLIGSMSHELKTPLTAIKGYAETLLSVKLSPEQEEKSLRYIHQESGRLSRLTEKMMELTRLYEPECKAALREVSLENIFETVENNVKHKLQETGIKLLREGEYQGRTKQMDDDLMISFLINLINNSIMASKSGSRIYLGADESSLWVRDEGCGIPPEEVDKVRKAFYRVDKSRSRKSGNMGLGLALCDQIAAAHHGRMKIESTLGEGTKISIVLESVGKSFGLRV